MINQLIRTKDFSPLHHLLRNPPPFTSYTSHSTPSLPAPLKQSTPPLLQKPPFPSSLPHSTLSFTSYAIHPSPLTQSTLPLICYTMHPFPPRTSCTIHPFPALPPYHIGSLRTGRFPVHCTPQHPMNCPWGNKNFTVDAPLQWND